MGVQLEAIKFNHDPASSTTNALNIRKNAAEFVTVPEWRRAISVLPEDSPAAYAIEETQGNTLTIQANLRRVGGGPKTVEVRAIDTWVNPPDPQGCLGWIVWLIRIILRAIFGNVLGEVKARTVTFGPSDETGFETFELEKVRLWSAGVGIRVTEWRWQYRAGKGSWKDIETTRHRIYSVVAVPHEPWQQLPYNAANTQLPWTEVLDYACQWAFLAIDRDSAAQRITSSVFDLGPAIVEYDCPGGGSMHYAYSTADSNYANFDCTAFLERLSGGPGNGQYVNCTDCASIVSVFSNGLGCQLWASRMGRDFISGIGQSFALNPILAIGSSVWEPACVSSGWSGSFSYHEVAWKGACTSEDEVFDACLKVDGDNDPTAPPHTPLLVANMRFGNPGDGDYRDRLATPAERGRCEPRPGSRIRRVVT